MNELSRFWWKLIKTKTVPSVKVLIYTKNGNKMNPNTRNEKNNINRKNFWFLPAFSYGKSIK